MKISELIRLDREFLAFADCLKDSYSRESGLPIVVNGLTGGASGAFLAEAVKECHSVSPAPVLILTPDELERARTCASLSSHGIAVLEFKPRDLVFHNISASHDIDRERLEVLRAALTSDNIAIVSTPRAVISYTMPPEILERNTLSLSVGDEYPPDKVAVRLVEMGFAPSHEVESRGQFSRRGGIVDFWSENTEAPVRVEFFGDEIDRIVYFDPITQRASETVREVMLLPASEMVLDKAARERISNEISKLLGKDGLTEETRAKLSAEKMSVESGTLVEFRDKYLSLIYKSPATILSYLSRRGRTAAFIIGTNGCREDAEKYIKRMNDSREGMISYGALPEGVRYTITQGEYEKYLSAAMTVHINAFAGGIGSMKLSGLFGFRSRRTVSYGGAGNAKMLYEDLSSYKKGSYKILLLSENMSGAEALVDSLGENGFSSALVRELDAFDIEKAQGGAVYVAAGAYEGFDLLAPKIAVLSMSEDCGRAIMEHRRSQRRLKRAGGSGKRLMSHADLSVGDYVVHANYGIGLFEGIETVTVDGVTKDYITIRYAGTDKLFVPCDRLEMIGKYIGDRDKNGGVRLSVMGGKDWSRTKSRAKSAVKDIAKSLIALYAERQRTEGFAFPPNTETEDIFDSEFVYEETESQLVAIEEIKRDMMRPVPMNRLLCGDVGFGKTEVALRAAFKAIMGGKQVALLVPTTILAMQHYTTALSRMRSYGVRVEMLSRFKKPKERSAIISDVKRGAVDLLIGTHAMLSKNVEFRDLGLLIIDEEQRFGVVQKEKLRQMTKNVDTLMLSATPIPRTLNMSMSGINDISVLDEAPGERRPVQTYVLEHDEDIILDALRRELDRGGQTLYIYNNIEKIDLVASRIADALPEARVTYAHGRMEKDDIEDIWQMLVDGEIDILVCTTIIETGVDLPNANTLVIEDADRFGLSQLHQIRGRVGRSERQAYAFFTYRRGKALSEIAERRLETIKEFAEFGAGFKIALRDLEIRGAGNLLGAEQHGYIDSVGYDLYIKLLNEAVLEERGEAKADKAEAQIVINISAHIPEYYIKSSPTRMEMYKKITFIECEADRDDLYDEFTDRFGDVPRPVERLLNVALAKALAEQARIKKIELSGARLTFVSEKVSLEIWAELFAKYKSLSFVGVGSPLIVYRLGRDEDPTEVAARIMSDYIRASGDARGTEE